ncbi:MAG: hypothetical protein AAGG02_09185 [Cyanobacteria bacterium P01_H01_bin.15]
MVKGRIIAGVLLGGVLLGVGSGLYVRWAFRQQTQLESIKPLVDAIANSQYPNPQPIQVEDALVQLANYPALPFTDSERAQQYQTELQGFQLQEAQAAENLQKAAVFFRDVQAIAADKPLTLSKLQNAQEKIGQAISQLEQIPPTATAYRDVTRRLLIYRELSETLQLQLLDNKEAETLLAEAQAAAQIAETLAESAGSRADQWQQVLAQWRRALLILDSLVIYDTFLGNKVTTTQADYQTKYQAAIAEATKQSGIDWSTQPKRIISADATEDTEADSTEASTTPDPERTETATPEQNPESAEPQTGEQSLDEAIEQPETSPAETPAVDESTTELEDSPISEEAAKTPAVAESTTEQEDSSMPEDVTESETSEVE